MRIIGMFDVFYFFLLEVFFVGGRVFLKRVLGEKFFVRGFKCFCFK